MLADVIVDLNAQAVDRVFSYSVPAGSAYEIGMRVEVPFGPRRLEGYIVGFRMTCDLPPEKIRAVSRCLEEYPAFTPEQLDIARYMQRTCKCTLAAALRLMIPAQMRGGRVKVKTVRRAVLAVEGDAFDDALAGMNRAPKRKSILETLRDAGGSLAVEQLGGASDALRALVQDGLIEIVNEETLRRPAVLKINEESRHSLTKGQKYVLDELVEAVGRGGRFLLHGVTGSGKTEVYMHLIEELLRRGMSAIMLVPEISLTPQMTDRFTERFGDACATLHSRLSPGERYDEWRRIRRGEARVVIGARSAVFAPVENLGAIIIDEEHEQSYQSDTCPTYDARDIASQRCLLSGGILLLGSATPSVSSYMRTLPAVRQENRYTLLELPDRVNAHPLPEVSIVDMRTELLRGNRGIFSRALLSALHETFSRGEQAILFLNRRGFSTFVSCRACGYVEKCESCDVAMTYHQTDELLHCHYCGAVYRPHDKCPACGSPYIKYFGVGTQKVEAELKAIFPEITTVRMDADTTSGKDAHARLLQEFSQAGASALIGTQMVAKGLDFPRVTLVGVIAADTSLNLPDYRAFERTFQLVTQAAGRAGRADRPGKVIVQTYDPGHYAVKLAAAQDYRAFFNEEARRRRQGMFPPFTIIARLVIESDEAEKAKALAEDIEQSLADSVSHDEKLGAQIIQMRAMEAPLSRIRGVYRWQIFTKLYAKGPSDGVLELMREQEQTHRQEKGLTVHLEINPPSIL